VPADAYKGVTLDPGYRSIIEAASRELNEQAPDPTAQLVGVVEGLRRPQRDHVGHITLSTFIDAKSRKVHLDLDAEIYERAIFAHSTKRVVTCIGTIVRQGRFTVLYDLIACEVAPPFDVEEGEVGQLFAEPEQ